MGIVESKVRVAHVVGQLATGGMEKLLVEFAKFTDRERFDLHFISLEGCGEVERELNQLGWPVTRLEIPQGFRPPLPFQLANLFRKLRVDVLHTHGPKPLIYCAPAKSLARIRRLIHTKHGRVDGSEKATSKFLVRTAARWADRIVCVSKDCAELAVSRGYPADRVCYLWNGIDLSRFHVGEPGRTGPIVSVGRMSPEKDFENLVRAAKIAAPQCPGFELQIAGDGACHDSVKAWVESNGLQREVKLLGRRNDVPELLSTASVFALGSQTEGISLAILEAMANGLPIAATSVGGNPEIIEEGVTGLMAPASDPEALAAAMSKLWNDHELRKSMSIAGRRRVEEHFSAPNMVAQYEAWYAN